MAGFLEEVDAARRDDRLDQARMASAKVVDVDQFDIIRRVGGVHEPRQPGGHRLDVFTEQVGVLVVVRVEHVDDEQRRPHD